MLYEDVLKALEDKKRFSLARYGDGEWLAILGERMRNYIGVAHKNTDCHMYFPDLGKALKDILESKPKYHLALQPLAVREQGHWKEFQRLQKLNKWDSDSEMFVKASISEKLERLFKVLESREVIIVANSHYKNFKDYEHVEISLFNCWKQKDRIAAELKERATKDHVVLYCASMMSEVLIDQFDKKFTQIDIGSAFDPYVGRKTRRYHYNL